MIHYHLDLQEQQLITINGQERPMRLLCMNILAGGSMKPNKLKHRPEKVYADHVGKS